MSRSSIESKIMGLENKLKAEKERRDQFSVPKGPGLRKPLPTPLGEFKSDGTPVRPRKNLDLSFISPLPKQDPTETEAKLKEIYKMQGKLKINGSQYYATQNDLEDLGELGNGSCGHVVKMLHKPSNQVIAVKQMRRSGNTDENKRIIMDLEVVLKSHDCPYIVQCLGCFITDADVWICMELMATCFDKLLKRLNRPIPEDILGKVTVATVNALSYLKNKHGVIHRDVKPSNILLDERGRIKLCDFGISGRLVDSKAKTRSAGCAAYMAPERIDLSLADYDIRADVWSLGITLVELATGQFPYMGCNNDFEVLTKVLEEDPPTLSDRGGFSQEFQNFVNRCLTKNYQQRPKYDELLKHPFVLVYTSKDVDVAEWFRKNDLHPDKYTNLRR
uniref:mitogen-activated protein kinase kinase n=1 Tax=Xenopsylla cheopis TaxID=163159 RepID=A0A6M2DM95_XENCH